MRVSVVIPSYNHCRYVIKAIDSVLGQTWPNIDLLVIDDGSTDGSAELIEKHHCKRGGYRYVKRENRGLIKTLNQGLSLADGEFWCELASDDYFPEDSIEKRVGYLKDHHDCVAVFADGFNVNAETETSERFLDDKRRQMLSKNDPIPDMLRGALPVFSTGLIRKKVLEAAGGFDEENFKYYEDLDTPIRLALRGKFGFLDEPVIYRRYHDTNVSMTSPHVRVEKVLCYEKCLDDSLLLPYQKLIKQRLKRSFLALGRNLTLREGGSAYEREVMRRGWRYVWQDMRLFYYLLRWRS